MLASVPSGGANFRAPTFPSFFSLYAPPDSSMICGPFVFVGTASTLVASRFGLPFYFFTLPVSVHFAFLDRPNRDTEVFFQAFSTSLKGEGLPDSFLDLSFEGTSRGRVPLP